MDILKRRIIFYLLLLAVLLNGCTVKRDSSINFKPKVSNYSKITLSTGSEILGSIGYVDNIKKIEKILGNRFALTRVMVDVNKYGYELDKNNYQDNLRLYRLVSYLIYKVGYVNENIHYFRNKLNRAPHSLEELLKLNASLPAQRRWRLLPVKSSLFHMQGADAIYNLKFQSADGFCEAVYNRKGVLLTEKNDPINMGTFNYAAGIPEKNAHEIFDIDPYLKWGNTADSPQKGKSQIMNGVKLVRREYARNSELVMAYRKKVIAAAKTV